MSTLLIKNARYIVSCDENDTLYERCNLFLRDNVVEFIGPQLRQAEQVIDASSMVVYPGLINTHHHLYSCFPATCRKCRKWSSSPGW